MVIEGPSRLAQKCLKFTEGKTLRVAYGSGKKLFPFGHNVTIYSYISKIKSISVQRHGDHREKMSFATDTHRRTPTTAIGKGPYVSCLNLSVSVRVGLWLIESLRKEFIQKRNNFLGESCQPPVCILHTLIRIHRRDQPHFTKTILTITTLSTSPPNRRWSATGRAAGVDKITNQDLTPMLYTSKDSEHLQFISS